VIEVALGRARNGLRFGVVVDSDVARCYKPDPRIFHRACEARPSEAG